MPSVTSTFTVLLFPFDCVLFCSITGLVCFFGFTASALTGVLNSIKFDLLLLVVLLELPLGLAV